MVRFKAWPFFTMYIPVQYGSVYNLVRAGREISLFYAVGISPDSINSIIMSASSRDNQELLLK